MSEDAADPAPGASGAQPNSAKPSRRAAKKNEIADRRRKVGEYMLAMVPQKDMATLLNVSEATIHFDVRHMRAEWRKEYIQSVEQATQDELAKLARDERRIRQRILALPADAHRELVQYQRVLLELVEVRAKFLGTYAPVRLETKVQGGGDPIVIEYRDDWKQQPPADDVEGKVVKILPPETSAS